MTEDKSQTIIEDDEPWIVTWDFLLQEYYGDYAIMTDVEYDENGRISSCNCVDVTPNKDDLLKYLDDDNYTVKMIIDFDY